ncbi:MAG: PaaI family thioesterase [Sphingomonadaceae bacterium]|nr:PaaI family thioesterase [Sphingomonadaceae bacterium]
MMRDASFDPAMMFRAMQGYGHTGLLGLTYVAHGADWAEIAMPFNDALVGDVAAGTMATGAVTGLLDMCCGVAVWTRLGQFRPQATLDLRIDYLRAAHPRTDMAARVTCYRVTRDIAFVRGVAHDGDVADPVAHIAATFMFTGAPIALDKDGRRPGFTGARVAER